MSKFYLILLSTIKTKNKIVYLIYFRTMNTNIKSYTEYCISNALTKNINLSIKKYSMCQEKITF